jgi:hypothetical protein
MTDLEMTKLCAEAMGISATETKAGDLGVHRDASGAVYYNPLHNDAQAMALVKRFSIGIEPWWTCSIFRPEGDYYATDKDLNRAIVQCVVESMTPSSLSTSTPEGSPESP